MALPKLPRNQLQAVDSLHLELLDLFQKFVGQELTAELCKRLAYNLQFLLGPSSERDLIFQTLMQYERRMLTARQADILARQLAARKRELEDGVLQLFEELVREEWVAMEVYRVEKCAWRETQAGVLLSLYCLNGHPAGHILQKKFPEPWMAWLAYQVGYSRRLPYDYEVKCFTGLRFWGYLVASKWNPRELDFRDWSVDTKTKKYNQQILRRRLRLDLDLESVREDTLGQYSCPFDKYIYCSDCRCTVHECSASYIRERIDVRRPPVDGASADDR